MANRQGNSGNSEKCYFLGSKITAAGDFSHGIKRPLLLGRKAMTNLDSILKSRDSTLSTKRLSSQSYGFSSSHVWMWELDHKKSWALKNWCFWTVVLEKTLESPLDCKESKPVNPHGKQSWIFIGRTEVEAEAPFLWPSDVKSQLIGKDPDAGKDWRQKERWLDGITDAMDMNLGDGEGQGGLAGITKSRTWLDDWTKTTTKF